MRSAAEWAKKCHELTSAALPEHTMCLDCARAYAREVLEAWQERASELVEARGCRAQDEDGKPLQRPLRHLEEDKYCPLNIAAALRALPGEMP